MACEGPRGGTGRRKRGGNRFLPHRENGTLDGAMVRAVVLCVVVCIVVWDGDDVCECVGKC